MKLINSILVFSCLYHLYSSQANDELEEDEEIVYGHRNEKNQKKFEEKNDSTYRGDGVKNNFGMSKSKYDFASTIKLVYSNYTCIDLKVMDLDFLLRKGVINENQVILIWESLLNSKTERNLEWLGYSRIIKVDPKDQSSENKYLKNIYTLFNSNEYKFPALFAYFGGIVFYFLSKFMLRAPKINLVIITFLLILNILNSFYFYNNKFYFTSFVCLTSFISNLYFIYLNLAVLSSNKEVDYSIFHVKYFKTREHFYMKVGICIVFVIILTYISSIALRYFWNYILMFFFLEKIREMLKNYFKLTSPKTMQPIDSFISFIFGSLILIFTHTFYTVNIYFSYDLNSFLFVNNFISFYYFCSLDRLMYIQRNHLGEIFLESEKINDRRDKYELFEELKKKMNMERCYRSENFSEDNFIDILCIISCIVFLACGFYFNTYFYLLMSIFILHAIHKNCLIFLSIKLSRIISHFLLLLFLIVIANLDNLNFSYINEIIAVYDQKFLDALLLLFKLSFLVCIAICHYLCEDFADMFNIYNYSSYRYLAREINMLNSPEVTRQLKVTYSLENVVKEIFRFDLATSLDSVYSVLDLINDGGSNINGLYIEYLISKSTSNYHIILLLIDYILMYFSMWILFDIFRNSNHSFFFITFVLHKLGLLAKGVLAIFEYSKTNLQKNILVVLNMIFITRLINYPECEEIDQLVLFAFFSLSTVFYIFFYENSLLMNAFFIIFFTTLLNAHYYLNSLLLVSSVIGMIFAKTVLHYLKINHFKILIYLICAINSMILFSSLRTDLIKWFYDCVKTDTKNIIRFDLFSIIEDFCFTPREIGRYYENILIANIREILHHLKDYTY